MVDDSILRSRSCRPHEVAGVEEYSGWLKKLGGKFKTWRKRFFVLRGSKLLYYTGPDEMRLLGEFSLEGTQAEMLSAENECNSDSKGYLFVVKPEDPTAFLTQTHQQFILCASNPEERKSWMRAIRKVLYLRHGGALFGTHLSEAFPFTKPEHGYHPRVVYDTTQFIRDYGMETEGIFRKCGTQHALLDLAEAYDEAAEEPILDPGQHSVHLVAGLLKYYLRELPEPVIPFRFYDRLKSTGFRIADGQDLAPLIDILESLPAPNYHLLQYLCQFLFEVSAL
ncbi:putative rho gtpase activating protein [Fasciola gigantica]|uniref:Putative rho gtpase activating protein n=1 Tax=Fasciola gigantica TaxID=46835 RepID=A0A504Y5M5_FASGI|nr:putative rho gtpase activating protein [Fasciola gigantica]